VIGTAYDGDTSDEMYGFKDKAQLAKVKAIAPVVGVEQSGSPPSRQGRSTAGGSRRWTTCR
jgi:hypothetical protein